MSDKTQSKTFANDFSALLLGLKEAEGRISGDVQSDVSNRDSCPPQKNITNSSRNDDDGRSLNPDASLKATETSLREVASKDSPMNVLEEEDTVVRNDTLQETQNSSIPDQIATNNHLHDVVTTSKKETIPDGVVESVVITGSAKSVVKKPTLRFHEAEDVGDATFIAAWERKIENMFNSTDPTAVRTTTVDVAVKSESDIQNGEMHQITSVRTVETISSAVDGSSVEEDDYDTDRDPDEEDEEEDDEDFTDEAVEKLYKRTEQILDEITVLQTQVPVQDAMIAKVLESIESSKPTQSRKKTVAKEQKEENRRWLWWVILAALFALVGAVLYQRFLNTHLHHGRTLLVDLEVIPQGSRQTK